MLPATFDRNSKNINFEELAKIPVFDEDGKTVLFGTLYRDQKTIVVFIRHFFCGICKSYVEALSTVRQDALDAANARMILVGCGEASYIKKYIIDTKFTGKVFADPTRKIYDFLGMASNLAITPAGEPKPKYIASSRLYVYATSTMEALKMPGASLFSKQGKISQLGGEMVLGPGNTCSFVSRMRHTEDHVEVADLMREAGIDYP